MKETAGFIPSNIKQRLAWGLASGVGAAVFFGFLGRGALEWNTLGYWLFVAAVAVLAAAMHGAVD